MNNEEKLKEYIRDMVKKELEEMTTTGNVAGYNIPMAFQGNNPKNKARKKGIATQLGMKLTPRGEKDLNTPADKLENLAEAKMRYHEYKKDESASATQKIAKAISEVNRNLEEVERVIRMNTRLQKESGVIVPIPTLPLPLTTNISALVSEDTLNNLVADEPVTNSTPEPDEAIVPLTVNTDPVFGLVVV